MAEEPESVQSDDSEQQRRSSVDWVALVSVVLLSVMAILTAWTGFQASKWGGAMSIAFTQAGAARLEAAALAAEAAALAAEADRRRAMQVGYFALWLQAESRGDQETMDALASRFHEPLESAFTAWLATKPLKNPDAPETPFDMPEYSSPEIEASAAAEARADALFAEGLENNQRGDNYTILAVVGAAVLFFAAISTRFTNRRHQWVVLGAALVLFAGVAVTVIEFPKLL